MYDNDSSDEQRLDVAPGDTAPGEDSSMVTGMVLGLICILVVVFLIVGILVT